MSATVAGRIVRALLFTVLLVYYVIKTVLLQLCRLCGVCKLGRAAARDRHYTRRHVVIVGAGVSGLAAAKDLTAAGVTVTVLEARDRIGGRIHTDRSTFGCPVELGAQFVHGVTNTTTGEVNPIWRLANTHGWATAPFPDEGRVYRRGKPVSDSESSRLWRMLDEFLAHVEAVKDVVEDADVSVEQQFAAWAATRGLSRPVSADMRSVLYAEVEGYHAADLGQLSACTLSEDSEFDDGGNHVLVNGYDALPRLLADGVDVVLGCVVTQVDASGSGGVVVTASVGGDTVRYAADAVIVSVPLGVLKAGSVQFVPPLPADKAGAIARMGFGYVPSGECGAVSLCGDASGTVSRGVVGPFPGVNFPKS